MKVLFFCQEGAKLEQLVLGLKLRWQDLTSLVASDGGAGVGMIQQEQLDLVIVCGDLADLSVWTAIRRIRRFSNVPLIVASEGWGDMEVVRAIELGADDHISMPCNPMIVMARAVALLRRVGQARQGSQEGTLHVGDLVIDPSNYEVFLGSQRLGLTLTEFKLLYLLVQNNQMTITQEVIQREVWPDYIDAGDTLKKYIQRLRGKLGDDARNPTWITTVHGVGYRFSPHVPTPV